MVSSRTATVFRPAKVFVPVAPQRSQQQINQDTRQKETRSFLTKRISTIKTRREQLVKIKAKQTAAKQRKDSRQTTIQLNTLGRERFEAERLLNLSNEFIIPIGSAKGSLRNVSLAARKRGVINLFNTKQARRVREQSFAPSTSEPQESATLTTTGPQFLAPPKPRRDTVIQEPQTRGQKIARVASRIITKPIGPTVQSSFFPRTERVRQKVAEEFTFGVIPKTTTELAVTGASFGIGAAAGGAVRGTGAVLTRFTPKIAPTVGRIGTVALAGGGLTAVGIKGFQIASGDKNLIPRRTGEAVREFGAFGVGFGLGGKVVGSGIGFIRTRGGVDVPIKSIADPKTPAGGGTQTFPSFDKGQTAGQFKAEFKEPITSLGEKPGPERGFSGRDAPLGDIIPSSKPRGNELSGMFSSSRLNTVFTRVRGSAPAIGLGNAFGGLPQVVRGTFQNPIEFVPGVRAGTKVIRPLKFSASEFSQQQKGSGRTFLDFSKNEKQVTSIEGSGFQATGRNFFTKIKGERVPIVQGIIGAAGGTVTPFNIPFSKSGFTPLPTSSIPTSIGIINPSRVVGASFRGLFGGKKSSFSSTTTPQSFIQAPSINEPQSPIIPGPTSTLPTSGSFPGGGSGGSGSRTPTPPPPTTFTPSGGSPGPSSPPPSEPGPSSFIPSSSFVTGGSSPFTSFPPLIGGAGLLLGRKRKVRAKQTFRRDPSFAAAFFGFTAPAPLKGEFTGLIERPLIRKKKKRRSKK